MNEFILTHIEEFRKVGFTRTKSIEIKRMIVEYLNNNNKIENFSVIYSSSEYVIYTNDMIE